MSIIFYGTQQSSNLISLPLIHNSHMGDANIIIKPLSAINQHFPAGIKKGLP